MKTLIMGCGNDLLGDDAVGILAARELRHENHGGTDVTENGLGGLSLLDDALGYERLILIDAIRTGEAPPGTIIELEGDGMDRLPLASPHRLGLPELVALARSLQLDFPREVRVFGVEIGNTQMLGAPLSKPVAGALAEVVRRVSALMHAQGDSEVPLPTEISYEAANIQL